MMSSSAKTRRLKRKQGIRLDIGCGENKQAGYIGMDKRKLKGVDIVHDAEKFPYPLEKGSCSVILMSHLLEHIKPWKTLELFNELWRLLESNGLLLISAPYATSHGYFQDPTHCNPCNETTFRYFEKGHPLWTIYKPKPWKIERLYFDPSVNLEVAMRKDG